MHYLPRYSEVLVSSMSLEEVIMRLKSVTQKVDYLTYRGEQAVHQPLFNGRVEKDSFRLSLLINKADSFLPLIKGKVESTPSGCIIFLDFTLFSGSIFFLIFWSVVTLAMGIFFFFAASEPWFALITITVGVGNIIFAWIHFKRKVKQSQEIFHEMLSLQKNK
ncbi:hypothetical protein QWY93_06070 [Echinicola jeungdonensis]|uniref:Uncharacterized protein n=1 Tax=Echinicola jeungdonensis TaxID=709343 RepID=A0ABV5J3A9_9BACT|nr:hypothetical protein [Echinicola jeungdonensis]MDN3668889.1 hypothetical protein [Echinicola jeungdonensis]